MVIYLINEHGPTSFAVAFDPPGATFRDEILEDYKAGRAETPDTLGPQFSMIREVMEALAIPVIEVPGFEADDVLATLATEARDRGCDVVVVTGDRDSFQLVEDPHVRVLYNRRGVSDYSLYDEKGIFERCGVPPSQYVLLASLRGDPSDNLPGIPGVGEKTAAKLLTSYGDLDGVFSHLDERACHGADLSCGRTLWGQRGAWPAPMHGSSRWCAMFPWASTSTTSRWAGGTTRPPKRRSTTTSCGRTGAAWRSCCGPAHSAPRSRVPDHRTARRLPRRQRPAARRAVGRAVRLWPSSTPARSARVTVAASATRRDQGARRTGRGVVRTGRPLARDPGPESHRGVDPAGRRRRRRADSGGPPLYGVRRQEADPAPDTTTDRAPGQRSDALAPAAGDRRDRADHGHQRDGLPARRVEWRVRALRPARRRHLGGRGGWPVAARHGRGSAG